MRHTKIAYVAFTALAMTPIYAGCSSGQASKEGATPQSSTTVAASPTFASSSANAIADGTCYEASAVNRQSATDVAQAFSAVSYCWDSTLDARTTDGMLRAKELMSNDFYETQQASQTRNMLQAQFNEAYKHQAYSSVKVSQTPGDTNQDIDADKAVRGVSTEWEWVGRDGEILNGGKAQDNVYLEKHDGLWTVVAVENTLFEND